MKIKQIEDMGNMRFKVGDRVRIKSLDWYNENKTIHGDVWFDNAVFVVGQSLYCGCELTIHLVTDDSYYVIENDYYWTDEMIEGLVEEETKPNIIEEAKTYWDSIKDAWICPDGYIFKDESGNIINTTKIVLEKKKEYPKTYEKCINELDTHEIVATCAGEGFYRPLKDGDIVSYSDAIAIFNGWVDETAFRTYVVAYSHGDSTIDIAIPLFGKSIREKVCFATEEEKQKLFDVIKLNGYKWNAETKTLEKLIEPKFKVGDKITDKNKFIYRITEITDKGYKLHDLKTTFITFEEADLYFVKVVDILDNMLDTSEIIYSKNLDRLLNSFRKLFICRDAYWKIAGEEMGLGKPWEPDWNDEKQDKYGFYDEVKYTIINPAIFVFPTEEMRDAFEENFNPDIEICKKPL